MFRFPIGSIGFALFFLSVFPALEAQETRTLRFLAVGEPPPFRQEVRDGVRYELSAPEGSAPPSRIEVQALNEEGEEEEQEYEVQELEKPGILLQLNRFSRRVKVSTAELEVRIRDEGKAWHSCKLPEGGEDYLLVLWRDPQEKKWTKAKSILLPDGPTAFKEGGARFINVASRNLGVSMGETSFRMRPGGSVTKNLGISKGLQTRVFYEDERGRAKRVWSSALVQNKRERTTVVVFFADGRKPRKPLKLISLREKVF